MCIRDRYQAGAATADEVDTHSVSERSALCHTVRHCVVAIGTVPLSLLDKAVRMRATCLCLTGVVLTLASGNSRWQVIVDV